MRIIAGVHRGRALTPVGKGDPGAQLRPTTDRVREALFNVLAGGRFGDPFDGPVLDLFAGTGALGLEALSRGASVATFVESGRKAQRLLRANIALLGVADQSTVWTMEAHKIAPPQGAPAKLVFLDPPYRRGLGAPSVLAAQAAGWINLDTLIVWEEAEAQSAPDGFELVETRRYGETWATFLRLI